MQCTKELSISIATPPCVNWDDLGGAVDAPGSPLVVGAGTLGNGGSGALRTQFVTTSAPGAIRWQTLQSTLAYNGGLCNCNVRFTVNSYSGTVPDATINIYAPLLIASHSAGGVGTTNVPFILPAGSYTITVECTTNTADAGGNVDVEFELTTT
jgi:hypothetical protein